MSSLRITLVGCGKMGAALLRGWLATDIAEHVYILDPQGIPDEFAGNFTVTFLEKTDTPPSDVPPSDVIVLAVKPQIMQDVCQSLAPGITKETLILSIAAGQTISSFEKHFGEDHPIIRAMPNTPAAIGKGITVATPNQAVSETQKEQAHRILQATGALEWLDDEALLNPVTALSGSGPAYVFLLIETLAKAGEKAGLPPALSMKLARQTVIGSAALAETEAATPAAELRQNVTSPGGTTAAALDVLMNEKGLQDLFDRAVAAAVQRGRDLG